MIRRQGYRFRLKPTQADAALLRQLVRGEPRLRYQAMCEYLLYLKDEYPFLREVHAQPLQQTLKDLDRAYTRAFDPKLAARFPRFKKKHRPLGVRFPQGCKIDGKGVYVPKIGWIGFRKSREIEGMPKNVSLSRDGRDWYVTIQTEREVVEWRDSRHFRMARLSSVLSAPDGAQSEVLRELAPGQDPRSALAPQDREHPQRYVA